LGRIGEKEVRKNIGMQGRLLRLSLAMALFVLAYYRASWLLAFAGLFVLFEAAFSWCVVRQFFGKNSCPK
jgi:hypothetical protein